MITKKELKREIRLRQAISWIHNHIDIYRISNKHSFVDWNHSANPYELLDLLYEALYNEEV